LGFLRLFLPLLFFALSFEAAGVVVVRGLAVVWAGRWALVGEAPLGVWVELANLPAAAKTAFAVG
jgi:hypothetical protein